MVVVLVLESLRAYSPALAIATNRYTSFMKRPNVP